MATTQVKRRRGTAAQCDAMTPAEGEIIVDTTNDRVRVGDGSTSGGISVPNAFDIQKNSFSAATAGGTADALTLTLTPAPASYTSNMSVSFKAASTNTGAATLNVNGLGATNLRKSSGGSIVALSAGDIVSGAFYTAYYDGTNFVLEGAGGGVASVTGSGGITVSPTTGSPNVSLNTNNAMGVGAIAFLRYVDTPNLSNGSTTAGSNLRTINISATGALVPTVSAPSGGTWRNIQGVTIVGNEFGLFIRTA